MNVEHLVYRCYDADGVLLYIGCTNSFSQRKYHHCKNSAWWSQVTSITTEQHVDRKSGLEAERAAIQTEHPRHNVERYDGTKAVIKRSRPLRCEPDSRDIRVSHICPHGVEVPNHGQAAKLYRQQGGHI